MASVVAESVSKRFTLRRDRADSVGQLLVRMVPGRRPPPTEPFWALRDVSFEMKDGHSLGIIGHNGAGKSTLLKILTKTMLPTTGSVRIAGRTSALIELGAGFHPDFTGRENIVLNASILGVGRRDIDRRMSDIIDFSGIAPFIDTPVKYYSSGMHARLGFSVAIHVDPELLIVDEILAVGDQAFAEQCMNRIFHMKRSGVGILLVTHALDAVETLMDDVIWLDHGIVKGRGRPRDVVHAYRSHVAQDSAPPAPVPLASPLLQRQHVTPSLELVECIVQSEDGRPTVASGKGMHVALLLNNAGRDTRSVHMRILVQRSDGLTICEFATLRSLHTLSLPPGRRSVGLHVRWLSLVPGTYDISCMVTDEAGGTLIEDQVVGHMTVWSDVTPMGVCTLAHSWSVE